MTTSEPTQDTRANLGNIELTRIFKAPRVLVFAAWTDPKHLAKWWGPSGFTNPRCDWDARAGGLIHIDMRGPNGTVYPMTGVIREVVAPERIAFTSCALDEQGAAMFEILNTVTFTEANGETTLHLRTELLNTTDVAPQYLKGQRAGWSQSLDRLEQLVCDRFADVADDRKIIVSREFDAPREMVWEAMTNPRHVGNWWGPRGFTTTIEEMDLRPGGVWRLTMHGPDGANFPNEIRFTEVIAQELIAYDNTGHLEGSKPLSFEFLWRFEALSPTRTRVTINIVFKCAADREHVAKKYGAIEGGKETLARLSEHLADAPLIVERLIDAPVAKVWDAVSTREQIAVWFFDLEGFEPRVGNEFQFVVDHDGFKYDHRCKVTEVTPRARLAYTWRFEGYEGNSLVTFELFPDEERTRLRLTHAGLNTFPKLPQFAQKNFMGGWTSFIGEDIPDFLAGKAEPAG